jgi:hypothetical protein
MAWADLLRTASIGVREHLPGGIMWRVSIRTLMAVVLVSAVGLAALRNASELWVEVMLLLAIAAEGVSILGAALLRGRERAWWFGFAVFAGLYLALAVGPWVNDGFRQQLITSHWLVRLRNAMSESTVPILVGEKQAIEAELARLRRTKPDLRYDPVVSSLTSNLRAIEVQLTANRNAGLRYDNFQRIGHAFLALLAGLAGGTVGLWFWARRARAAAGASSDS